MKSPNFMRNAVLFLVAIIFCSVCHAQETLTWQDGAKYVGDVKDGTPNGQGIYDWPNGARYVGEFKDGKRNGQGTFTLWNGAKYVGGFKDGKKNGQGTMTWPDGEKYVGEWKNDTRDGQGIANFSDMKKYVGEFKNDRPNGQGTMTDPSGLKLVGEFNDGKLNGKGEMVYTDGRKYIGEFKDGYPCDQGTTAQSSSQSKAVDLDAFLAENVALYSNSEVHYSFGLPDGWKEIPKSVIDKAVADTYSKTKMQRIDYTNGYQLSKNNYFQYPYILIQKHNVNTPSYSQIEKSLTKNTFNETIIKNTEDFSKFMNNATGGETFFDKNRNIIFSTIQIDIKNVGKINGLIANFIGKEEIIQFNFYALSSEYSQWLPVFNSIIDSFKYKPAYVYDSEEAAKRNQQTFLDLLFKDVAKKGFSGLVTGVVLGIIVACIGWSRFKKKNGSKSSQSSKNNDVPPKL